MVKILFVTLALLLFVGCASRPEVVAVQPDYPRLIKYPRPDLIQIDYDLAGDHYCTAMKYTDIINNEIKLKTQIEKYEQVIDKYNSEFVDVQKKH
jgi:hypothetical protein